MLEDIKLLLGITDNDRDDLLELIIRNTTSRLKLLIGGIDPPEELNHVITDVSIMRFNRIGSEGLTGHTVEGESLQFRDDDFAPYSEDIEAFLRTQQTSARGKVRFL